MLADVHTPVGIYLRLRDKYRDTILLESADYHAAENSASIIGINAIAGIEITDATRAEIKYPATKPEKINITPESDVLEILDDYMSRFTSEASPQKEINIARGLFGYTSFDAIPFFENIRFKQSTGETIPLMRYRMYQYVIIINHFKDEMFICENYFDGLESNLPALLGLIQSKNVPAFPFALAGKQGSNVTDSAYIEMVERGIASCMRGDVFQIVLSRQFTQKFTGDDFNVYRALRSVNPSPYLFYFDYGDYKLAGSSPESQVLVKNGKVTVHPIAGTFKRSGNEEADKQLAEELLQDEKESAEHVMLVDLARNDLSRLCNGVEVHKYKEVQYFSHVIHLVSEVTGLLKDDVNPFRVLAASFPAGTLSGAPKHKALTLIDDIEPNSRGFYGGAIGYIGFDGAVNHAIMIRTFLSRNNTLTLQAGAGVVAASVPANELLEVHNKLGALQQAIEMAGTIHA